MEKSYTKNGVKTNLLKAQPFEQMKGTNGPRNSFYAQMQPRSQTEEKKQN